jgi:hypothetical protein
VKPQGLSPAVHQFSILHRTVILGEHATFLTRILGAGDSGSDVSVVADWLPTSGTSICFQKFSNDLQIPLRAMLVGVETVRLGLKFEIDSPRGILGTDDRATRPRCGENRLGRLGRRAFIFP